MLLLTYPGLVCKIVYLTASKQTVQFQWMFALEGRNGTVSRHGKSAFLHPKRKLSRSSGFRVHGSIAACFPAQLRRTKTVFGILSPLS